MQRGKAFDRIGVDGNSGKINLKRQFVEREYCNASYRERMPTIPTPTLLTYPNEIMPVHHAAARASHIVAALAKGDNVELRNFGVFEVKLTKPRVGRNPNEPGSSFVIPARATVKFKSGKVMKEKVAALTEKLKSEGA